MYLNRLVKTQSPHRLFIGDFNRYLTLHRWRREKKIIPCMRDNTEERRRGIQPVRHLLDTVAAAEVAQRRDGQQRGFFATSCFPCDAVAAKIPFDQHRRYPLFLLPSSSRPTVAMAVAV